MLNIAQRIGMRPTVVVGNSGGDLPMIRNALDGAGPRLGDNFLLLSMQKDFTEIRKN